MSFYFVHPQVLSMMVSLLEKARRFGSTGRCSESRLRNRDVGHYLFRPMSMMQMKELVKTDIQDEEKVLIDVKSLYQMDELKASGIRFWRL